MKRTELRRKSWIKRAGGRCEMVIGEFRCPTTEKLTVHHKTYSRLGKELPIDVVVLCKSCHDRHHATVDSYKRRRVA